MTKGVTVRIKTFEEIKKLEEVDFRYLAAPMEKYLGKMTTIIGYHSEKYNIHGNILEIDKDDPDACYMISDSSHFLWPDNFLKIIDSRYRRPGRNEVKGRTEN